MKITPTQKLLFIVIISIIQFSTYAQQVDYEEWKLNFDKGVVLIDSNKYKNALPYLETAYKIAQRTFTKNEDKLGNTAFQLATAYKSTRKYQESIPLYLVSLDNLKLNHKDKDSIYGDRLNDLGVTYRFIGEYKKASETLLKSLDIIENNFGKQSEKYADNLLQLSIAYKKNGDFTKAISSNEKSNDIIKQIHGGTSKEYATNLSSFSQIYNDIGDYDRAIQIQKEALSTYKQEDKTEFNYAFAAYTMALLYFNINEYKKAIPLYMEAISIFGEDHRGSISAYNNLGQAYDRLGDYEKALFYTEKVIDKTSENNADLPIRLQNLAFIYVSMGNYKKAEIYYDRALTAGKKIFGTDHYLYGKLVNNIGKFHEQKGDINQAKTLYKEALDNFLKTFDENHFDHGYYLNDYARTLLKTGDTIEAISLMKKNLSIFERNSRTKTEDYYKFQSNLAKVYNITNNYNEALPLLLVASENIKIKLGADHPDYGGMLKNLSDTYIGLRDIDKAIPVIETSNLILINQLDKIFKFSSEKEKKAFLNMLTNNFEDLQSIPINNKADFDKLNEINLNNQLMLKGLLLNNSKDVLAQLSTLNDSIINQKINYYRTSKRNLSKQLSLPITDRVESMDSLKNVINTKESELVKLYSTSFNESIQLVKNWKRSQSNLKDNEVAIEFSSFRLTTKNKPTDSIMYVAYLYKKKWQHPKMISLFEEKQLKKVLNYKTRNTLYSSDELYDLVWNPLEKHTGNGNTIYYSPSGLLNQISFAAIKKDNILGNKYNLVHLSSTAILENKPTEPSLKTTLFIGAIDYDYHKTLNNKEVDSTQFAYLNMESLSNLRGTKSRGESWTNLPGALMEINSLQDILKSNGYYYDTLTKEDATEANFKKLSGNSPSILHIATHGFFYENLKREPQLNMSLSTEDQYRLAEDPLQRSGLILAGANYAWKNGVNPNEEEDGILTAMEISNLDLSNTDMVVLSACETGLGDIDGSEGVYGLQRAFKLAGVDIIVMSLWKVPDTETAEFMNLFYNNWMKTKDVRNAFNNAQRTLQHKYKDEPLKWAAFVLFE